MSRLCFSLLLLFLVLSWNTALCGDKISVGDLHLKGVVIDPDPYGDFTTLIVPIKRAGNLIIVEAQVDSLEGNFVLDTGAPYLVLNTTYFRDAPHVEEQHSAGINGESEGSFTTVVHNFSILDLHYSRLTA